MRKFIAGGCSFTLGNELSDDANGKEPSRKSWAYGLNLASRKPSPTLNYLIKHNYICTATEGSGNPPAFGFTVEGVSENLTDLKCYHSDASQISDFQQLGNRFEVRFDGAFAPGRTRINCTMLGHSGRWRWFGMQYYVPPE